MYKCLQDRDAIHLVLLLAVHHIFRGTRNRVTACLPFFMEKCRMLAFPTTVSAYRHIPYITSKNYLTFRKYYSHLQNYPTSMTFQFIPQICFTGQNNAVCDFSLFIFLRAVTFLFFLAFEDN